MCGDGSVCSARVAGSAGDRRRQDAVEDEARAEARRDWHGTPPARGWPETGVGPCNLVGQARPVLHKRDARGAGGRAGRTGTAQTPQHGRLPVWRPPGAASRTGSLPASISKRSMINPVHHLRHARLQGRAGQPRMPGQQACGRTEARQPVGCPCPSGQPGCRHTRPAPGGGTGVWPERAWAGRKPT